MRLRRLSFVALATCCLLAAPPASADDAAEAFLKSWIGSIDASPEYRASYESIVSDEASDTTFVHGLLVTSLAPGFRLAAETIAITGFIPSPDDTFAAAAVRIEGAEVGATDFARVEIANAEFRDFSVPTSSGFSWDDRRPFVSMVKTLSPLAQVEMSSGRISSVTLYESVDDVEHRIAYEQVNIDGWSSGKIAATSAGPITSESPANDQLIAMSIASAQSRDIDFNAFLHVLDPDNYAGGVGDRIWHTVVGSSVYRDVIVAVPGVTFTMSEAAVRDLKLRQPKGGIAILAELGPDMQDMSDEPAEVARVLELLTAYGVGSMSMHDIEVTAPGIDELSLASLSITDFSSDKLGEFALDRLAVTVEEAGSVSLRRFAFGGLVPPSIEAFIAAMEAEERGDDVDVSSVVPQLGFLELAGVDVAVTDYPRTTLERLRLDLNDYVGPVPTSIAYDLVEADVDASLLDDADARKMLAKLGYDRVVLSSALRAHWTNVGDMIFDSFSFAMKDVGTFSGDLTLTGILPTEHDELDAEEALARLSFVRGTATAKDDSIVGRGLAMQAEELGVDPEAFREQFAMGLPFMLAFLGDPKLQSELAPVLQQFIKTAGGSITMVANPPAPLPLLALMEMAADAPFELVKKLNVTFSGVPGLARPAAAPAEPAPKPSPNGATQFDPEQEQGEAPDAGGGTQFDSEPLPDDQPDGGSQVEPVPLPGDGTQFD